DVPKCKPFFKLHRHHESLQRLAVDVFLSFVSILRRGRYVECPDQLVLNGTSGDEFGPDFVLPLNGDRLRKIVDGDIRASDRPLLKPIACWARIPAARPHPEPVWPFDDHFERFELGGALSTEA